MASASVPPSSSEVLRAELPRDPELGLRVVAWLVVGLSALQVLLFAFGRDQGIYAEVASALLDGKMPYRDAWDFKPPGIFLVFASAFALFGENMMAPRVLEVLALIGTVLGCRRLGETFFGGTTAGLLGGAVGALVHAQLDFWHSGQPESFAGLLTVLALVLTTRQVPRRRELLSWSAVGLLFGLALLLKPPLGGGAAVCASWLFAERRRDGRRLVSQLAPFLVIGLATLMPVLLVLLWFWARGALPELAWTLGEFTPGYTRLGWEGRSAPGMLFHALEEGFFRLSSLLAGGIVAAAALHPRANREREGFVLVLGVLAMQLTGVALQGKFFQYHFAASVPLVGLLAGAGFYKLWRRVAVGSLSGTLAFVAFVGALAVMKLPVDDLPLGFWERSRLRLGYLLSAGRAVGREELEARLYNVAGYRLDAARAVADELRRELPAGAPIYVWGFEPVIYWLSEHPPATRYVYNVPQRAEWKKDSARRTLLRELAARPPAAIVVQRWDSIPGVVGTPRDSADELAHFPELAGLLARDYAPARELGTFTLWYRRR